MSSRAKLSQHRSTSPTGRTVWAGFLPHRPDVVFKRTAMGFAVGAAVLPLLAVASAGAATVPPVPSPATVLTIFPWEGSMEDELQGTLCQAPNNCVPIKQSLWDPNGLATIEATIDATAGTKVVFSYSEGARSVTDWLQEHADDPEAPSPDELSFVVIGNPTRAHGGSDNEVMPQTQYQVIDISRQYDPASDFPDHPFNLLALLNSVAAFTTIHTDYEDVDMYDPTNIVWKEGNTTYVFVPTENLPLLEPLRRLGLTGLADALNGPLKEIVERGYDRSYLPTTEEEPADTTALSVPPASDPAAAGVELESGLRGVDGDDSHVIETLDAASAPDAGVDDVEDLATSEAGDADEDGTDSDATAADDAQRSTHVRTVKAGSGSTSDDESARPTIGTGSDTHDAATKGDGDGSSSGDDSSDGDA